MGYKIACLPGDNSDLIELCGMLDHHLNRIAGGEEHRRQYLPHNKLEDITKAFVAYLDGIPAGCAAFRRLDNGTAEIKRVFVREECRGRGIAKRLMEAVEHSAGCCGVCRLVLETGAPLTEALALYRSLGYTVTENYGPYKGIEASICMEKLLPSPKKAPTQNKERSAIR